MAWGLLVPTMSQGLAGRALVPVVRLVTRRRGMPKQLCAVRSVVASFLLRFLASKPGSEVSNTEEPCDGDGTSHGEAERGPHALWLRWWVFCIPCGGLRGRVQFAFRCPVHGESAKHGHVAKIAPGHCWHKRSCDIALCLERSELVDAVPVAPYSQWSRSSVD